MYPVSLFSRCTSHMLADAKTNAYTEGKFTVVHTHSKTSNLPKFVVCAHLQLDVL